MNVKFYRKWCQHKKKQILSLEEKIDTMEKDFEVEKQK